MDNNKLNLESIIDSGKFKGKSVSQLIELDRKIILELVKNGYDFEEEVYEKARFKHIVHEKTVVQEIVDRSHMKDTKVYPKDTDSVRKIMDSILTLNNSNYSNYDDDVSIDSLNEIPDVNDEYDEEI